MKKLISTMILVTFLSGCQSTNAQTRQADLTALSPLKIETYTASEAGFVVNSHLIEGTKEAILVDAQFTESDAKKAVEMVRRSGKALTCKISSDGSHPISF